MELISGYMRDEKSRHMLNALTRKTFGFDFEGLVTIGTLILELDIIYLFTSAQTEPLRAAAHVFICSFAFMLSGLLALRVRRTIWNVTTVLSFCIMAMAVLDLFKALSGS